MNLPKCINQFEATYICCSKTCTTPNPFICDKCQNNECEINHNECPVIAKWANIKNKLEKNMNINNPQLETLSIQLRQIILQVIKTMQKSLEEFDEWKKKLEVNSEINNLFKNIDQNKQRNWNGKLIQRLTSDKSLKNRNHYEFNQQNINIIRKQIQKNVGNIQKLIKQIYIKNKKKVILQNNKNQIKEKSKSIQSDHSRKLSNNQKVYKSPEFVNNYLLLKSKAYKNFTDKFNNQQLTNNSKTYQSNKVIPATQRKTRAARKRESTGQIIHQKSINNLVGKKQTIQYRYDGSVSPSNVSKNKKKIGFIICIKSAISKKTFSLFVDQNKHILDLKRDIEQIFKIGIQQQKLYFGRIQLSDEKTIGYYGIAMNGILSLIVQNKN